MSTLDTEQPAPHDRLVTKPTPLNPMVGRHHLPTTSLSDLVQRASTELLPYLRHQVHYVGRAGIAGIALVVFSVICFFSANAPQRTQLAELQSEYTNAQEVHAKRGDAKPVASPQEQRKILHSTLQTRSELPAITETIIAQAAAAGLALERGSYAVDVVRSGQLVQARLTFPVHGTYPKVRQFIDGTLNEVAGATVDGLRLERKEIGAAEVNADIRFIVYLRNGR